MNTASRFITAAPSDQNVVDLFAGEWTSKLPSASGLETGASIPLFEDTRINWVAQVLGPLDGRSVLELGPLEGGHTYMLHNLGAHVTAVEANSSAFLRCLCVKEIFKLDRVSFKLGDFMAFLAEERRYDLIVASGVIYDVADPLEAMKRMAARTDKLFLWTHYFDAEIIARRSDRAQFSESRIVDFMGAPIRLVDRRYPEEALSWTGFTGGSTPHAVWMTKGSTLAALRALGFADLSMNFDQPDHPNGPAFAVAAIR